MNRDLEEFRRRRRRRRRWFALALVAYLAFLYPATVGPAAFALARGWLPGAAMKLWQPVHFLFRSTPLARPMSAYIQRGFAIGNDLGR